MTNKQTNGSPAPTTNTTSYQRVQPLSYRYILKKYWIIGLLGPLLIVLISGGVNYYLRSTADLNNVAYIIEQVESHVVLPTSEMPALVTVTDNSKLSTPFLKQTENGDKVLIYQKNKKAIIYRPSIDKIIDIGPVSIDAVPISE